LKQLTLIIIGGYGTFGARLVQLLKDNVLIRVYVAGRSLSKAKRFCDAQSDSQATLIPISFDRVGDSVPLLGKLQIDIVIDASGPFQYYEKSPTKDIDAFTIVRACIELGINYLDLADSVSFVKGIAQFDTAAKKAGVFCLSGVSSFPVLTAVVTKHLAGNLNSVNSITAGIAPSPYAGVGENVIKAIASYAGQPVRVKNNGEISYASGLTQSKRFTVASPGKIPLRNIQFSLVDVPDLHLLAEKWPSAANVWMGAGTTPEILHKLLKALAWLVHLRLMPNLAFLAPMMHWVINHIRWGEHRGGMFVEVVGTNDTGATKTIQWNLIAEGDHGPLIPCMAMLIMVTNVLNKKHPSSGARSAIDDVTIEDYEDLFKRFQIFTGSRELSSQPPITYVSFYEKVLASYWPNIPSAISRLHSLQRPATLKGKCTVNRGANLLAKLAASIFGLPKAGTNLPISIEFSQNTMNNSVETWTRTIGKSKFVSHLSVGVGKQEHLLCEQVGPAKFYTALVNEPKDEIHLVLRSWKLFGMAMPMLLAPKVKAFEKDQFGSYRFFVEIRHPLIGLIVSYQGNLEF
jgi:saccharopine dehydrogenase-like NADP-dependent oxidoreductase